eukprot:SAG31_NODE_2596_length_5420_cov_45.220330_2_plen_62_part_00
MASKKVTTNTNVLDSSIHARRPYQSAFVRPYVCAPVPFLFLVAHLRNYYMLCASTAVAVHV